MHIKLNQFDGLAKQSNYCNGVSIILLTIKNFYTLNLLFSLTSNQKEANMNISNIKFLIFLVALIFGICAQNPRRRGPFLPSRRVAYLEKGFKSDSMNQRLAQFDPETYGVPFHAWGG